MQKSKLVLIEASALGMMGIDQMYVGNLKRGIAKLAIFLLVMAFTIPVYFGFNGRGGIRAVLELWAVGLLWGIVDYASVMWNALSRSHGGVLNHDVRWTDGSLATPQFLAIGSMLATALAVAALVKRARDMADADRFSVPCGEWNKDSSRCRDKKSTNKTKYE